MSAGGFNAFNVLSGVQSGLQAYSTLSAAEAKAEQAEFRAEQQRKDQELAVEESRLQAQQKQQQINEQLDDALEQRKAVQGAMGVDTGSGSAKDVRDEAVESAQEAKQRVGTNLALNRLEQQSRIEQLQIAEKYQPDIIETRGKQRAAQGLASFGANMALQKHNKLQKQKQIGGGGTDNNNKQRNFTFRGSTVGGSNYG